VTPGHAVGSDEAASGIRRTVDAAGIVTIAIERAAMRNSLDRVSVAALTKAFEASADARCVILRSDGSSFCSGGDLPHLVRLSAEPDTIRGSIEGSFQRLIRTIRRTPVPVIARVQGAAVGAGADLALACDLRVASASAWLREAWIDLGLVSALGAPATLSSAGGPGFALDVLLSGRKLDAAECLAVGLFQRVVGVDELDAEVDSVASVIAARDPQAVRAMKELVAGTFGEAFENSLRGGLDRQERLMRSEQFVVRVRDILHRITSRSDGRRK
jgi:enoyl-CoA hydratase/carnithine racemase